jgi:site-specific DNA-cytosine methylase
LQWNISSIDLAAGSNATLKKNILYVKPEELHDVPDFIWASPPCETYSNLAGGRHRNVKTGEYEKTEKAKHHNSLFTKMVEIMNWARRWHPHLIVVIENPVGCLQNMPLMVSYVLSDFLLSSSLPYLIICFNA